MKYLLDTNTVSFAIRGVGRVGERILRLRPDEIAVSAVTEAELWFGVDKVGSKRLERAVNGFLSGLPVLDLDRGAARTYGTLRARLERRGAPIGVADTLIAAHAISRGLTLVTNNTRHFKRIPGLAVEDWL